MSRPVVVTKEVDHFDVLRDSFGFTSYRDGQQEAIESVLSGRDTLFITPTGGGKSLVYQIPAMCLDGLTIVVSPLISLMKDQVDGLRERDYPAACLNSTLSDGEKDNVYAGVNEGRVKLLYMAPEGISPTFLKLLRRSVSLLAIDEAHCISQWGHDFRPKYLQISRVLKALGRPPCLGTTATATDVVRKDIAKQLGMKSPQILVRGFDRPNLGIHVNWVNDGTFKTQLIADFVRRVPGSVIIYCGTKKNVMDTAQQLRDSGVKASPYHGGLTGQQRTQVQEAFMADRIRVVVATNAFGMGVDKPNIRGVLHHQMPGSLEAYYQEIGRAGRDGKRSVTMLLYNPGDRRLHDFFTEMSWPPKKAIEAIFNWTIGEVQSYPDDKMFISQKVAAMKVEQTTGTRVQDGQVGSVWQMMERAGVLKRYKPNDTCRLALIQCDKTFRGLPATLWAYLVDRLPQETWVELSTIDLAKDLDVTKEQLSSALRALDKKALEYHPPDRFGGVQLLKVVPIEDAMDWGYLDARRQMSYRLTDQIARFAQQDTCRRAQILRYFGDQSKRKSWRCGTCDVCRRNR